MVNPQPSILGQQPVQTMGPAAHQYNVTPYASGLEQPMIPPQPSAGWASAVPALPQSMPVQMINHHPYMPSASMPQMTPGMMQMPGQGGVPPPAGTVPPYRPNQM